MVHPGVPTTGLKVLFDGTQETAVILQHFASAEDMETGGQVSSAMESVGRSIGGHLPLRVGGVGSAMAPMLILRGSLRPRAGRTVQEVQA